MKKINERLRNTLHRYGTPYGKESVPDNKTAVVKRRVVPPVIRNRVESHDKSKDEFEAKEEHGPKEYSVYWAVTKKSNDVTVVRCLRNTVDSDHSFLHGGSDSSLENIFEYVAV